MGWSEEVHTSRLTDASVRAKRQARLRRTNKLPEAEGSATPGVLLAAAGAVFATIILQHNQHQERVKGVIGSILDNFAQFLPHPPARVSYCRPYCAPSYS